MTCPSRSSCLSRLLFLQNFPLIELHILQPGVPSESLVRPCLAQIFACHVTCLTGCRSIFANTPSRQEYPSRPPQPPTNNMIFIPPHLACFSTVLSMHVRLAPDLSGMHKPCMSNSCDFRDFGHFPVVQISCPILPPSLAV